MSNQQNEGKTQTNDEIRSAKLAGVFGLVGAIIGGAVSITATWIQQSSSLAKAKAAVIAQDRKEFLVTSQKLFGEYADILSYLDTHDNFNVVEAKKIISKARRAAFEFATYASPEISIKALAAIESLNAAIMVNDPKQIKEAMQAVTTFAQELSKDFYNERERYNKLRDESFR